MSTIKISIKSIVSIVCILCRNFKIATVSIACIVCRNLKIGMPLKKIKGRIKEGKKTKGFGQKE